MSRHVTTFSISTRGSMTNHTIYRSFSLAIMLACCVACTHAVTQTQPAPIIPPVQEKLRPVWHRAIASARTCFRSLFSGTVKSSCMSWSGQQGLAGPLADQDTLYIGSWDATLKKLSTDNGHVMASTPLPARVSATPARHKDRLLVGLENGMLLCLDRHTLQPMWEKPQQLDADIAQQPLVQEDKVYVLTGDSSLYAIAIQSGQILWRQRRPMGNLVMLSQSPPLILPGSTMRRSLMLVGNREGKIEVYDTQEGNLMFYLPVEQQDKPLRDVVAGPIAANNVIVAASISGKMRAWRQPDFEEDWSIEESGLTHLVYDDVSKHVIAAGAGKILAVDIDSGQITWRFHLDKGAATNVILRSGHVYVADSAGGVLVLHALTGKIVQWLLPRSRIVANVNSNADGLYVVSERGIVYGFKAVPTGKNSMFQDAARGFIGWQAQ